VTTAEKLEWMARGSCRGRDLADFYPEKGTSAIPAQFVCAGCPVLTECREYALKTDELWGTWGGLTEQDRQRIRSGKAPRPMPSMSIEQKVALVSELAGNGLGDQAIADRLSWSKESVRWVRDRHGITAGRFQGKRAA
jgi:hypothetical protein